MLLAAGAAVSEDRKESDHTVAGLHGRPTQRTSRRQLADEHGSLNGNRYSSLKQIDKSNVATLKQAWKINLGTCKTKDAQCGSLEANAAVAERHLLHSDSEERRLRARRSDGGHALALAPTYDPSFSVGSGGRQPGVAVGDGMVFAGLP